MREREKLRVVARIERWFLIREKVVRPSVSPALLGHSRHFLFPCTPALQWGLGHCPLGTGHWPTGALTKSSVDSKSHDLKMTTGFFPRCDRFERADARAHFSTPHHGRYVSSLSHVFFTSASRSLKPASTRHARSRRCVPVLHARGDFLLQF